MPLFQKVALAALLSVIVLIFVGAIVRATGAGLGCPDWPKCWGRFIPPTSVDQVDFDQLNLDRFKKKAARHGRDPDSITEASLREEFNPTHVWTEYINRLTSLPVGFFTLATMVLAFGEWRRGRRGVFVGAVAAFILVLWNAWLGSQVVLSGLKPGIITLHMFLAILLMCVLVYVAWRGCEEPWRLSFRDGTGKWATICLIILFASTIFEGLMGSQVREMTDQLAKLHPDEPRSAWTKELEQSWMYLAHRSFSWFVLGAALAFYWLAHRSLVNCGSWLEKGILGIVLAQMVLGLILAHVGVLRVVQILHIGLSSLLVSGLFLWLLGALRQPQNAD